MNEFMRDTSGESVGTGEPDPTTEYRIREVEARLDRRVTALEGRPGGAGWAARVTTAGLFVAVVVLAAVVWSAVPRDGAWEMDRVSTEEIVLRDTDGVQRGLLATDADGRAHLSLSDQEGRERIHLTVLADGSPGVTISDPDGRPRAVLGYLADGTTNLVFADAQGTSRAVFGLEPDGSTQALFADRDGTIRTLVGVGADGEPAVSIFEDEGAPAP